MTPDTRKRLLLYPLFALVLGGLVYGGFIHESEPDVATLVSSAEVLAQAGMFEEAIENGERALTQEPDNRYAHIILGYATGALGDHRKSVVHYRKAVAVTPSGAENSGLLQLYLAEALLDSGEVAEGEKTARDVLAADPDQYQAWYVVGRSLCLREDFAEAEKAYLAARNSAPEDPQPLMLLSDLAERQKAYAEARVHIEEAATLTPDDPEIKLRRARILLELGDREAAVVELLNVAETHRVRMQNFLFGDAVLSDLRTEERLLAQCPNPPKD